MAKAVVPRWTYFDWGVMDSGKTTKLLTDRYNYLKKNWKTITVKPGLDDRTGNMITSDLSPDIAIEADVILAPDEEVIDALAELIRPSVKAVFVDELQFVTPKQAGAFKMEIAQGLGIPVLTYGLLKDFRNQFFPASELYWNDPEVKKREKRAICFCGDSAATVNVRREDGLYVFEGDQIGIEKGLTTYETYCEMYFEALKDAIASGEITRDAPAGTLCGPGRLEDVASSL